MKQKESDKMTVDLIKRQADSEVSDLLETALIMQGQISETPHCTREWLQRIILLLSAKKVVRGEIHGGVLILTSVPEGVEVDINDYDVEGTDDEDIKYDDNGKKCFKAG